MNEEITDTEMLDWLEANLTGVNLTIGGSWCYTKYRSTDGAVVYSHDGDTLRDVVRAAMKSDAEYQEVLATRAKTP